MKVSVVVPTYRRHHELHRCCEALACQSRAADQVVIVVRAGDKESAEVVTTWRRGLEIEIVQVMLSGQVHALNAGLKRCTGDIVAITDDDAAPRADWLARIEAYFEADPKLGGLGGRDWVHQDGIVEAAEQALVGRVLWYGRVVGNHHLGVGGVREVDVLKGANCAFRMAAIGPIGFDTRLLGKGAQVHNDMVASLAVKQAGWKIVFDPAVAVDHYPAPRFDRDQRHRFDPQATADSAYNFRLALREISPTWKRVAAFFWHYVVGTRDEPGLVNLLRLLGRREQNALLKFRAAHGLVKLETE
jgi:cellulose synthase/poly-beta-1,6-N-acetylglucosamine synthase-like glycosyltransferase